jgi:hypothetical protein
MTASRTPSIIGYEVSGGASATANFLRLQLDGALEHFFGSVSAEPLERTFAGLAETWRVERGFSSSLSDMVLSPSYQRIIGLGSKVLPLLLAELAVRPDHWFAALQAITGANPVTDKDRGNIKAMSAAWVTWGRERGIIA